MTLLLVISTLFTVYLYVGWYQPFHNFKNRPFAYKRKMVKRLLEDII